MYRSCQRPRVERQEIVARWRIRRDLILANDVLGSPLEPFGIEAVVPLPHHISTLRPITESRALETKDPGDALAPSAQAPCTQARPFAA